MYSLTADEREIAKAIARHMYSHVEDMDRFCFKSFQVHFLDNGFVVNPGLMAATFWAAYVATLDDFLLLTANVLFSNRSIALCVAAYLNDWKKKGEMK